MKADVRQTLIKCRADRYGANDYFAPMRKVPDMESYLSFAQHCIDKLVACADCGRTPSEQHPTLPKHILAPCYGGGDEWENLIPLCSACHYAAMREELEGMEIYEETDRRRRTDKELASLITLSTHQVRRYVKQWLEDERLIPQPSAPADIEGRLKFLAATLARGVTCPGCARKLSYTLPPWVKLRIGRRFGGKDEESNWIALCSRCLFGLCREAKAERRRMNHDKTLSMPSLPRLARILEAAK